MANAGCINAYDCNGCLIQTLQNLDSACIGVGVQYTAPNPLDDKRLDYIKYTDKCGCVQCLSAENEILIYATNGVIKNLTLTNDDVNEAIKIKWNDIFGSNRAKTIVRYKTGSYPVSITDGTLAVEETTKNQYSSTPFSLSGVLDETTYYITAFAVDSNDAVIGTQQTTITTEFGWHPSANTLAYYPLTSSTTVNEMSGKGKTLTNSGVTFGTYKGVDCAYLDGSHYLYNTASYGLSGSFTALIRVYYVSTATKRKQPRFYGDDNGNIGIYTNPTNNTIGYNPGGQTAIPWDTTKWQLATLVYDSNGNYSKLYINGINVNTFTSVSATYTDKNLGIGGYIPNPNYWKGGLSGFILENKVWSESDILKYYNKTKSYYGL